MNILYTINIQNYLYLVYTNWCLLVCAGMNDEEYWATFKGAKAEKER